MSFLKHVAAHNASLYQITLTHSEISAGRWLFIIEGVITIVIAFAAFFVLPNFPRTTTWLTENERQLAIWRLDEDIGEDDWIGSEQQSFFHGMKLAFADIKMWILVY